VALTSGAQKQGSTEAAPVGRKSVIVALVPISSISQLWGVTLQPGEWKDAEAVSASIRITGGNFRLHIQDQRIVLLQASCRSRYFLTMTNCDNVFCHNCITMSRPSFRKNVRTIDYIREAVPALPLNNVACG
jgi:hypothetical protein